jgi:ABC-type transporter Mla MlaB component
MRICLEGNIAYLQGDWILSGMTSNCVDSLADSLRQIESGGGMNIRIDCGRVSSVDISGLQLLDVWMQCAKFRGLEPELVNLPDSLQPALQKMGLRHSFTNRNAHLEHTV